MPCCVFFALLERCEEQIRLENFRSGLIATVISSIFTKEGDQVTTPAEWFEAKEPEVMDPEVLGERLKLFAMMKQAQAMVLGEHSGK
jgi:hypothetical protein